MQPLPCFTTALATRLPLVMIPGPTPSSHTVRRHRPPLPIPSGSGRLQHCDGSDCLPEGSSPVCDSVLTTSDEQPPRITGRLQTASLAASERGVSHGQPTRRMAVAMPLCAQTAPPSRRHSGRIISDKASCSPSQRPTGQATANHRRSSSLSAHDPPRLSVRPETPIVRTEVKISQDTCRIPVACRSAPNGRLPTH